VNKDDHFRVGDYVTFHTKDGQATGIIEDIFFRVPKSCMKLGAKYKGLPPPAHRVALITVRNGTFKPKKYHRALYKLKRVI